MDDNKDIQSPVVSSGLTKFITSISVADIKKLYKQKFGVQTEQCFHGLEEVQIRECVLTKYRYYYPFSVAGDSNFYESLQNVEKENQKYYREWGYDHQFAYDIIKNNEYVLDIGCGSGNFLLKLQEKTKNTVGLEFNQMAIEKCKLNGLNVFSDTIQSHALKNQEKYDVICLFQVLEHIHNVSDFLNSVLKALKRNGKLIIGVPNNEPYRSGYDKYSVLNLPPHHMGLWNNKSFSQLPNYFEIQKIHTGYDLKGRVLLDAYFRAKLWCKIKSQIDQHKLSEKLLILLVSPISLVLSVIKKMIKGINGAYIVVMFEKNK